MTFSNKSFARTVAMIRKAMPYLAITLLLIVYFVSAVAEGFFLAKFIEKPWLAFAIAGSIQATRALLVFFTQLNPNRPNFSRTGEIIAVVMGLISIGSIIGLIIEAGLPTAVGVSLSVLMLAGIGVEIFFLQEIRYATEVELFNDQDAIAQVKDHYTRRVELANFLDQIKDQEAGLLPQQKSATPSPIPTHKPKPKRQNGASNPEPQDFLELSLNGLS